VVAQAGKGLLRMQGAAACCLGAGRRLTRDPMSWLPMRGPSPFAAAGPAPPPLLPASAAPPPLLPAGAAPPPPGPPAPLLLRQP
jgi:hypothetical protein